MRLSEIRALPSSELVNRLVTEISQSYLIRQVLNERMIRSNVSSVTRLLEQESPLATDAVSDNPVQVNNLPTATEITTLPIHEVAKIMLRCKWRGQGMDDEERACEFILMSADNPNIEEELNEKGKRFWSAARFKFKSWVATQRQGV